MAKMGLQQSSKFQSAAVKLALHPPVLLGYLEWMFNTSYGYGSTKESSPYLGTPEMVEATAYWDGPPGKFFDAISRPGHFLDEVAPGHWAIHNWLKHAPDFVRKRVKKLEEMNPDLAAENWWKGEAFALAVVGRTVIFPVKSRPPADEGGGRAENGGLRQPPAAIGSYRQPRVGVRDSEEALLPSPSSTLRNFGPVETAEKARQEADEIPVLIRRVSSVVVELTQLGRGGEVEAIEELMEGALSRAEWASLADQAEEILAAYAPAAAVIS